MRQRRQTRFTCPKFEHINLPSFARSPWITLLLELHLVNRVLQLDQLGKAVDLVLQVLARTFLQAESASRVVALEPSLTGTADAAPSDTFTSVAPTAIQLPEVLVIRLSDAWEDKATGPAALKGPCPGWGPCCTTVG